MPAYLNAYSDRSMLIEEVPAGERQIVLQLDERADKTFQAISALNSLEVMYLLTQVALSAMRHAHSETRKVRKKRA